MSELRIIVVFRADIEMPRGKSEVQFGHAVEGLCDQMSATELREYHNSSRLKISMEVDDLDALMKIWSKAVSRGIQRELVKDAGRTVFAEPTITCIGLGPMTKTDGNALTRDARMRV